jgi:hypothetical protein
LVASTETFPKKKLGPELVARNQPLFHDKLFNPILDPPKKGGTIQMKNDLTSLLGHKNTIK